MLFNFKKLVKITIPFFTFFLFIFCSNAYAVDSSGIWKELDNLNFSRNGNGIALLKDGKVLTTAGMDNNGTVLKSTEIYNPNLNEWSIAGDMKLHRILFAKPYLVTLSDGEVIVAGGQPLNYAQGTSETEIYNPDKERWTQVANSHVGRYRAVLAPLPNNKAMLISGATANGNITPTTEIYDPINDYWEFAKPMIRGREADQRYAILKDGRILVAGGRSNSLFTENTAEVYSPTDNTWTLSKMPYAMRGGALTVLQDGRVLMTGGYEEAINNNLSSTAIYEPSSNTWTPAAPMPIGLVEHGAVLLSDGKVLVFGGRNNGVALKTSFIYDPSLNIWKSGPEMPDVYHRGAYIQLLNGDYLAAGGDYAGIKSNKVYLFTNGDDIHLGIPYFNQNDEPWGSQEYDSESKWNPENPNISSWGCALTSAAMVLNYYGYNLLPEGNELNPLTLNEWMKEQNDNFIRNGNVSWDAIKRLTEEAKEVNGINFDALEYDWIHHEDNELIKQNLENKIPSILEIKTGPNSSHFVVVNGIKNDTFTINDPAYTSKKLLSDYENTYKSIRVLRPSHTDLSSILLVVNGGININVASNLEIFNGFQTDLLPIENDNGDGTSGETLNSYYINRPRSGNYTATLSSNISKKYKIDVYLYDENANVKIKTFNGVLFKNSNDEINIDFDKFNSEDSKINRKRALGLDLLNKTIF